MKMGPGRRPAQTGPGALRTERVPGLSPRRRPPSRPVIDRPGAPLPQLLPDLVASGAAAAGAAGGAGARASREGAAGRPAAAGAPARCPAPREVLQVARPVPKGGRGRPSGSRDHPPQALVSISAPVLDFHGPDPTILRRLPDASSTSVARRPSGGSHYWNGGYVQTGGQFKQLGEGPRK
jgi:hypothetical protein